MSFYICSRRWIGDGLGMKGEHVSFYAGSDLKTELQKLADQNKMTVSEFCKANMELVASGKFSMDKRVVTEKDIGTILTEQVDDIDKMTPEQAAKILAKRLKDEGSKSVIARGMYGANSLAHLREEFFQTHEHSYGMIALTWRNVINRCLSYRSQGGKAHEVLQAEIIEHNKAGVSYVDKKERSEQKHGKRSESNIRKMANDMRDQERRRY